MSVSEPAGPASALPTEGQIEDLVATFYARVREDPDLGPVFARVVGADWGPHLRLMCDFWSSVMLTSGRYKGRPIPAHIKVGGITPRHFERWLELFSATARELFQAELAEEFVTRATRIALSFRLAFAFHSQNPEEWVPGMPKLAQR